MNRCLEYTCKPKFANGWGAIAFSTKDRISGWAYEKADKASAANLAMQYCVKQGGAKCQVITTFYRTCGSVASDGNVYGWGTAGSKQGAQERALAECAKSGGKDCTVEAWTCSAPNSGSDSAPEQPAPRSNTSTPRNVASWGAIAYSARDMGAGWSQGKEDRASAERDALSACTKRGKQCVVQTAFRNECGALAADGLFTGWATSTDQTQALQKALAECRKSGGSRCVPHIAFCSF